MENIMNCLKGIIDTCIRHPIKGCTLCKYNSELKEEQDKRDISIQNQEIRDFLG